MSRPKVGIVIVNFNGTDDTLECVRSVVKVRYPNFRTYVVDNGSTVSPREKLSPHLDDVTLIENDANLGYTGGNNVGCRRALEEKVDYVLLLNNDTTVDPGFLDPMVDAMERDDRLGMVTPKIYFYGQDRVFWAYGAAVGRWTGRSPHLGVYRKDTGQFDSIREVDRITGCAMFVRREVFERVGFLDDRFFIYCEELDWCLRTRRAGWRLEVVPESVIWHKGHRDSGRIGRPFIAYLQTRNQLLMLRKQSGVFALGGGTAALWHTASLAKEVGRNLLAWMGTQNPDRLRVAGAFIRGVVDYWRGNFGKPPY